MSEKKRVLTPEIKTSRFSEGEDFPPSDLQNSCHLTWAKPLLGKSYSETCWGWSLPHIHNALGSN